MKKLIGFLFVCFCAIGLSAEWTPYKNLSEPSSFVPQVVVDRSGNAIAIWGYNPGSPNERRLFSSFLAFGSSQWSTPIIVSTNLTATQGISAPPKIAVDGCGNAVAIWSIGDSSNNLFFLQSATLRSGSNQWSNPVIVTTNLTAGQEVVVPVIAMNSCGNGVATWGLLVATDTYAVQAATFSFDSGWSTPVFLTDLQPGQSAEDSTQVAIDGCGNAIAIWGFFEPSTNSTGVQSATLRSGSDRWSTPIYATSGLTNGQSIAQPQIVMDNIGNAVSVWGLEVSTNVFIIQAVRLPFGSLSWSTPTNLTPDYLSGFPAGASPQITVDGCGNISAIWGLSRANRTSVETAVLPFGSTEWGVPVNLTPDETAGQIIFGPQISADSNGNIVALWPLVDLNTSSLVMQAAARLYNSSIWGKPQTISVVMHNINPDPLSNLSPDIAIGGRGKAVAIWDNIDTNIVQSSHIQLTVPSTPFSGKMVSNQFLSQTEYAHVLTWKKSDHPCIGSYRIYLGNRVVGTTKFPETQVCLRKAKNAFCNYRLVPVTTIGVETDSTPIRWL